jgi:branched-subunit amino acid ABC-type transport system permease component
LIEFLQQLINGLSLGAIYALIALGYTMIYGVLRFINFAHGDVFMVGAFAGLYVAPAVLKLSNGGPSWPGAFLVLLVAMVVCTILGIVIEKVAYRPLRNRPASPSSSPPSVSPSSSRTSGSTHLASIPSPSPISSAITRSRFPHGAARSPT